MTLVDVLWGVSKLLITGFCLPIALFIFYTSSNRALIEQYPNSIIYKTLKFLDTLFLQIIKATEIDPNRPKPSSDSTSPVLDLHGYTGIDRVVSVRQSFSASLDLSSFLTERHVGKFNSAEFLFVTAYMAVVCIMPIGAIFSFLVFDIDSLYAILGVLLSMIVSIAVLFFMLLTDDSILSILHRLIANRAIVFTFDNKMISTYSGWGHFVFKNDGATRIASKTTGLINGLYMVTTIGQVETNRWILRVPSFVMEKAFKPGQLEELCQKLNSLATSARLIPDLVFDEIRVEGTTK